MVPELVPQIIGQLPLHVQPIIRVGRAILVPSAVASPARARPGLPTAVRCQDTRVTSSFGITLFMGFSVSIGLGFA